MFKLQNSKNSMHINLSKKCNKTSFEVSTANFDLITSVSETDKR